jgi:hypothetical protein
MYELRPFIRFSHFVEHPRDTAACAVGGAGAVCCDPSSVHTITRRVLIFNFGRFIREIILPFLLEQWVQGGIAMNCNLALVC